MTGTGVSTSDSSYAGSIRSQDHAASPPSLWPGRKTRESIGDLGGKPRILLVRQDGRACTDAAPGRPRESEAASVKACASGFRLFVLRAQDIAVAVDGTGSLRQIGFPLRMPRSNGVAFQRPAI